jgi:hypothetical protein
LQGFWYRRSEAVPVSGGSFTATLAGKTVTTFVRK